VRASLGLPKNDPSKIGLQRELAKCWRVSAVSVFSILRILAENFERALVAISNIRVLIPETWFELS
jgi:hypothetical protein